jgi:hypothetical protein
MTWDELLLLLQSYKKEEADMSGPVRFHGNDTLEPLVLAEKSTTGELIMVVNWDTDPEEDDG